MTERNLWMQSKGVKINAGKLTFDVRGKADERIGMLTLTDTSVTWRASYQRKNRTKTIPWEKFSDIMIGAK